MQIPYLAKSHAIKPLVTDTRAFVIAHRARAIHRRIIAAYRAGHPLCEKCLAGGLIRSAQEVHHITPVSEGGDTTPENLLSLCLPCHPSIHQIPKAQQLLFKQVQA